jgi:hypothetical protein
MIAGTLVILTALALTGGLGGMVQVGAQQARRKREERSTPPRVEYRQAEVVYTRIADLIGEWEEKGWETYQVVPVFPANPSAGRPMTVTVVFRKSTK